jgi:arylsulfatase A-like enzyme
LLGHVKYAFPAGLAVGLAAAAADAVILGARNPGWMAFAFLAYGLTSAACLVALSVPVWALCRARGYRPGPRALAAFYIGLPFFGLAALAVAETIRRAVIPAVFKSTHEAIPVVAASLCGFLFGAVFVALIASAMRRDRSEALVESASGASASGGRGRSTATGASAGALKAAGLAVVGLAILSALGLLAGNLTYGLAHKPGKNLIIVCVDALRPDHLSCYGYAKETSPNIDALARSGAIFERAICQSPGSTASHASVMTSLYPLTHGAWNVGDSLQKGVPSLQKLLHERGYATAFFGNNYFLEPRFGFAEGFDTFGDEEIAYKVRRAPLGLYARSLGVARLFHLWRYEPGVPSEFSISQALSWIEKNRRRKFFVFVHLMDPHAPYSPPSEYRHKFFSREYEGEVRDGKSLRKRIPSLKPWEKEQLVDLYDGEVAYADSKVGRLISALRGWGLDEDTVIVVTADHGEVLTEHGGIFNHGYLWDCCVRVPLIFSYPPAIPGGVAKSCVVQSIDIAPTALSLMGEAPLESAQGRDLTEMIRSGKGSCGGGGSGAGVCEGAGEGGRGHEGAAMGTGETAGAAAPAGGGRAVVSGEAGGSPGRATGGRCVAYTLGGITKGEGYAITGRRWKLAWIDDEHVQLYDLLNDPGETRNLIAERPEVAADLKRQLLVWMKESAAAAMVPRSETVDLNRLEGEVQDRLRTLGYIK